MWFKYLLITIAFFILALVQASFFTYFSILGAVTGKIEFLAYLLRLLQDFF